MASWSASQRIKEEKYAFSGIEPPGKRRKIDESSRLFDVFINHRGPDVKQALALPLYKSLDELGINAFLDSEEKELGDSFPSTIEGAILSASVHIAIFSEHYAESPWCLAELVLMSQSSAKIIPVFYRVDPSAVRHVESGEYAEAFRNYEKNNRHTKKLEEWKDVLHYVSFLTGHKIRSDFSVSDCQSIVSAVSKEVQRKRPLHVAKYPVGLDRIVTDFDRRCETKESGKKKGQIVGIYGKGGVGKTTLAKELFNRKQSQYTKTCFLCDVREAYANKGFHSLQIKLLKDLYHQENLNFQCIEEGKSHIQDSIRRKQQLSFILVLDDVDHLDQLDALLIWDMLNKSVDSLVIVTTRDAGLLTNAGIRVRYNLEGINESEGKELFCGHALSGSCPSSGCEKLVELFVNLCGGLPLSLQVLGGHVHGTDHKFWKLELEKVKKTLPQDIEKRLRISIETLDNDEKQIFVDVACFFIGEFAKDAIKVWEASGWSAQHALRRLKDKCLVEEGEEGEEMGALRMHDHLRDLGRRMADELSHPRRLWRSQNLQSFEQKGFENILKQTAKYRYLHSFMDPLLGYHIKYFLGESVNTLEPSPALLWLELGCRCHQLANIPPWIPLQNLQSLIIRNGKLEKLWQNYEQEPLALKELRIYNMFRLENLCLGLLPRLEELVIHNCGRLKSLTRVSVLASLVNLEIVGCGEVEELCFAGLISAENIIIHNCGRLKRLTGASDLASLVNLEIVGSGEVEELCLAGFVFAENIIIHNFGRLKSLTGVSVLASLVNLEIIGCGEVEELCLAGLISADNIIIYNCGHLKSLTGVSDLARLMNLEIVGCGEIEELCVAGLISAEKIIIHNCGRLKSLTGVSDLARLMNLEIVGCGEIEELCLVGLISAKKIIIHNCAHLKSLTGVSDLARLMNLEIVGCGEVEELSLVGLKSAEKIIIHNCGRLKILAGVSDLESLMNLEIIGCEEVEELCLVQNSCLKETINRPCHHLKTVTMSDLTKLKDLKIGNCGKLEKLSLIRLSCLIEISIHGCGKLKSVTASDLTMLEKLDIVGCRKLEELSLVRLNSAKKIIIHEYELPETCHDLKSASRITDDVSDGVSDLTELVQRKIDNAELKIDKCVKLAKLTKLAKLAKLAERARRARLAKRAMLAKLKIDQFAEPAELRIDQCAELPELRIDQCAELAELKIDKCEKLEELNFVRLVPLEISLSSNLFTRFKVKGCENLININGIFWKPVQFNVYDCPKLEKIPDMERFNLSETVQLVYCRNETIWNYTLKMKKLPSEFIKLVGRAADGAASILNANIFCDFFFAESIIQNGVEKICEHLGRHSVAGIVFCAVVVVNSRTAATTTNEIIRDFDNPWLKYEVRQGEWMITSVTSNQDDIHRYIVNKGSCYPFDCLCFLADVTMKCVTMPVMKGEEHKVFKVLPKIVDELYHK